MSDINSIAQIEYRQIAPGYRIGNDGSAWSQLRGKHPDSSMPWKRLKGVLDRRGYQNIFIHRKRRRIHTLVLEAFVGLRPLSMECRHADGNPANNRLDNLSWGTHQENMDDLGAHGRRPCGERSGAAKFTANQIREIRRRRQLGESTYSLAVAFDSDRGNISRIVRRITWKDVG